MTSIKYMKYIDNILFNGHLDDITVSSPLTFRELGASTTTTFLDHLP